MPDGLNEFEKLWDTLDQYGNKFASGGITSPGRYVMTQGERVVTADELRRRSCDHATAVPVDSIVTGEILAHWCEACETQLPASLDLEWRKHRPCQWGGGGIIGFDGRSGRRGR